MNDLKKGITYLIWGWYYMLKASFRLMAIIFVLCFIAMILSWAQAAFASDEEGSWFCDTQSSKYESDAIVTCGVGVGTEAQSRLMALNEATKEFYALHPNNGQYSFHAGRTDCTRIDKDVYRCVRLVRFHRKS